MRKHVLLEVVLPFKKLVAYGAQIVPSIRVRVTLNGDAIVIIVASAVIVGARVQQRGRKRWMSGEGRVGINRRGLVGGLVLGQQARARKDNVTNAADVRVRGHGGHVINDTNPLGLLEREFRGVKVEERKERKIQLRSRSSKGFEGGRTRRRGREHVLIALISFEFSFKLPEVDNFWGATRFSKKH